MSTPESAGAASSPHGAPRHSGGPGSTLPVPVNPEAVEAAEPAAAPDPRQEPTAPSFHPKQRKALDVLMSDATDIALGGGARSGKTFLLVYALLCRAFAHNGSRHAIFRYRLNALISSIVYDTLPKVITTFWGNDVWEACKLDKQHWYLKLPNGSEIWFGGLDEKERTEKILGQEYTTIYFNECSQIPYASVVMALTRLAQNIPGCKQRAYYDFNPPTKRHWTYKVFVEKVDPDSPTRKPLKDGHLYSFLYMNPNDNKGNLSAAYLRRLENMPARARKRFLLGQFADDSQGLLWEDGVIDNGRLTGEQIATEVPDYTRVVIAVDPSGCSGPEDKRSDEVGIVVIGLGTNGHAYVVEDLSGRWGPKEWSSIVSDAWERHSADCIVAEQNYGGAMVEATITSLGETDLNVKLITASRGKAVRAEPIANLYCLKDGSKVHHLGYFPELEQQMNDFTVAGYQGPSSPDRADALVWGLSELFGALVKLNNSRDNDGRGQAPVQTAERSGSAHSRVGKAMHRRHSMSGRR